MGRLKKYNKLRSESLRKSVEIVYGLLLHHPYFKSEILNIRKQFGIPIKGLTSTKSINKIIGDRMELYKAVHSLLNEFNIPVELKDSLIFNTKDYIITNINNLNLRRGSTIQIYTGFHLYVTQQVDGDNALFDKVYIEITPNTTIKDIKENWYEIESARKNISNGGNYNLGIKKVSEFGERLYELTQEGYSRREAVEIINKEKKRNIYVWNKSSNSFVHNALNEYKRRLNELREI